MKVLITGSNGQVGQSLSQRIKRKQWEIHAFTRNELDITDWEAVESTIQRLCPDLIINCAAYTAVDKAEIEMDLAYSINKDGADHLATASAAVGAAIIHLSTDYVFNGSANKTHFETDAVNPQTVYGCSKLAGEQCVASRNRKHIILRTSWVFGEYGNNFVKTMIRLGMTNNSINVVADQEGAPTYAGDIAETLIRIADEISANIDIKWGLYHYSGAPHTTWYEFAQRIFHEASNSNLHHKSTPILRPITTADYPTRAQRPKNSKLNCSKIYETFNIKPSNWLDALKNIDAYNS